MKRGEHLAQQIMDADAVSVDHEEAAVFMRGKWEDDPENVLLRFFWPTEDIESCLDDDDLARVCVSEEGMEKAIIQEDDGRLRVKDCRTGDEWTIAIHKQMRFKVPKL